MINKHIGAAPLPFKQRGIASLIVVLLVGLEVLALSASTLYSVHGTQERQVAAHAQVNSQISAWTGVENTRLYLASLDQAGIDALAVGTLAASDANLAIQITQVENAPATPNTKRVTALVTAKTNVGESASRVQVVYEVSAGATPSTTILNGSMLKGDTDISGGMNFTGATGSGLDFFVEGDLTFGGTGIGGGGLRKLVVTGDFSAGSQVKAETLITNGKAELTGGSGIRHIYAMKDVIIGAGVSGVETIHSDGNVSLSNPKCPSPQPGNPPPVFNAPPNPACSGSAYPNGVSTVIAQGTIKANSDAAHGDLLAKGDITLNSGAAISAQTTSNLFYSSNEAAPTPPTLLANGNITCRQYNTPNFLRIQAGGSITDGPSDAPCASTNKQASLSPAVVTPTPQTPFTTPNPSVDVWTLKSQANYVYEYIDNKMMVTISNITGLTDGQYVLSTTNDYRELGSIFVCKDKTVSCATVPNSSPYGSPIPGPNENKIYLNNYLYSTFSYSPSTSLWTVGGNTAPGVSWFKGNLSVSGGVHFNTFLATEWITVANAVVIAPNVAGDAGLCKFNGERRISGGTPEITAANNLLDARNTSSPNAKILRGVPTARSDHTVDPKINGIYSPRDYSDILPKNFCDTSDTPVTQVIDGVTYTRLKPNTIGNIAIAAGGKDPSASTPTYSGGRIELQSGVPYGNVLAGEELITSGSSRIYGHFIAADLKAEHDAENVLGAALTVDLRTLAIDFVAEEIPNMGTPPAAATTKVLWSQYP